VPWQLFFKQGFIKWYPFFGEIRQLQMSYVNFEGFPLYSAFFGLVQASYLLVKKKQFRSEKKTVRFRNFLFTSLNVLYRDIGKFASIHCSLRYLHDMLSFFPEMKQRAATET